jgi:uncharacterized sulfatase
MQSLVDYAPTLLSFADLPIPRTMSGKDQRQVWLGREAKVRDHVICEFRHEPTTLNLRTYSDRYRLATEHHERRRRRWEKKKRIPT